MLFEIERFINKGRRRDEAGIRGSNGPQVLCLPMNHYLTDFSNCRMTNWLNVALQYSFK
jgi:hypothetical protein